MLVSLTKVRDYVMRHKFDLFLCAIVVGFTAWAMVSKR